MRGTKTLSCGDRAAWIDRLDKRIGRLPRERLLIFAALLAIAGWGFSGSWDYPALDSSLPGSGASLAAFRGDSGGNTDTSEAAGVGAGLFEANGCYACHSIDGTAKIGPSLGGVFGANVELEDGSTVPVDDEYILESILEPQAKRVAGYAEVAMPDYGGLLSAEDARALVEYIKSLR
jgi:cytochrome c2